MARHRTVLFHPKFLVASLLGSLVVGVISAIASLTTQITVLGVLLSMQAGLVLAWLEEQQRRDAMRHELSALGRVVDALEEEPELAREFRRIGDAFQSLTEQTEPVFRQVATTKLLSVGEELGQIATGKIVFRETESWRTAYQNLLRSEKLKLYRSVAWVQCADYWQDAPGRQSMRENYDAINRGVIVERIIILPREFWPPGRLLPTDDVLPWIMDHRFDGGEVATEFNLTGVAQANDGRARRGRLQDHDGLKAACAVSRQRRQFRRRAGGSHPLSPQKKRRDRNLLVETELRNGLIRRLIPLQTALPFFEFRKA